MAKSPSVGKLKGFFANGGGSSVSNVDNMRLLFAAWACLGLLIDFAPAQTPPASTKAAVFAGGCFWCIQPAFDKAPGVIKTTVGYCGGTEPNPSYELVGSERTKYRES